jgi:hypothetical protein
MPHSHGYIIELLSAKAILDAYPLARLGAPDMAMRSWKRQAHAMIGRRNNRSRGILIARHLRQAHLCGMLSYRTVADPALGKILQASNVIAVDIADTRTILHDLLAALRPRALLQGCQKIQLLMSDMTNLSPELTGVIQEIDPACEIRHCLNISMGAAAPMRLRQPAWRRA